MFPYDYVSSLEKLKECKLPCKDDFFNKLNEFHISAADYIQAISTTLRYPAYYCYVTTEVPLLLCS